MIDLKPCAHCSDPNPVQKLESATFIPPRPYIACSNCGCSVPAPNEDPTPEGARRIWNTRNGVYQGEVR